MEKETLILERNKEGSKYTAKLYGNMFGKAGKSWAKTLGASGNVLSDGSAVSKAAILNGRRTCVHF